MGGDGGAGESTPAGDKLEPTAREDPDSDRSKLTITKRIQWEVFHSALGGREVASSRAAHPRSHADSGRLGTPASPRGRGLRTPRMVAAGRPPRGALHPLLLESSWRPPSAGTSATLGHLTAPSRVKPPALTPTRRSKPPGAKAGAAYAMPPGGPPGNLHSGGTFPPRRPAGLQSAAPNIAVQTQTFLPVRPRGPSCRPHPH